LYEGEYKEDKKCGWGEYYYLDIHDIYKGYWKDNNKHLFGIYYWAKDGNMYVGNYKNGQCHGFFKFWRKKGDIYQDSWGVYDNGQFKKYYKDDELYSENNEEALSTLNRFSMFYCMEYKELKEYITNKNSLP